MERATPHGERIGRTLVLPSRSLLVLCGPAGCGKSTFAQQLVTRYQAQGLRETTIVSSDYCRALVCDDETNQQVNRDTFDLFHYIIHKRMFQNRFTIADSTALQAEARRRLLEVAQRHSYYTCLLIFNVSAATCLQRDQQRHRLVGEQVILYHIGLLQQAMNDAPQEGWSQIQVISENNSDIEMEFVANSR